MEKNTVKKGNTNGDIFAFQCFLIPKPWGPQQHLLKIRTAMFPQGNTIRTLQHKAWKRKRETEQRGDHLLPLKRKILETGTL